ncbi:MAG: hypothetical protein Q8930_08115 [Bacillota bacterium]|nr:hypothetical protein [Bacillota bacterium]
MNSADLMSMVAQNCESYEPPMDIRRLSNSAVSVNCENCSNYVDGKCRKNFLDSAAEMFGRN